MQPSTSSMLSAPPSAAMMSAALMSAICFLLVTASRSRLTVQYTGRRELRLLVMTGQDRTSRHLPRVPAPRCTTRRTHPAPAPPDDERTSDEHCCNHGCAGEEDAEEAEQAVFADAAATRSQPAAPDRGHARRRHPAPARPVRHARRDPRLRDQGATIIAAAGNGVFTWLPLLFAVGIAIGWAKKSDGIDGPRRGRRLHGHVQVFAAMSPIVLAGVKDSTGDQADDQLRCPRRHRDGPRLGGAVAEVLPHEDARLPRVLLGSPPRADPHGRRRRWSSPCSCRSSTATSTSR